MTKVTLPSLISSLSRKQGLSYSTTTNSFLTQGFTSAAGNTYFNSLRVSEHLVFKEDVGKGYARTFLNGLAVYDKNGVLLAEERYHCCFYSLATVQEKAKSILIQAMQATARREGVRFELAQLRQMVNREVEQSVKPLTAQQCQRLIGSG